MTRLHGRVRGWRTFKSLYTCHGLNFAGAWPDPVLSHQVQLRFFVNCYYCILRVNKIGYIIIRFPQPNYRKSKLGLHRLIEQTQIYSFYCMTKPKFWFSMIHLRKTNANVPTDLPFRSVTLFFLSLQTLRFQNMT